MSDFETSPFAYGRLRRPATTKLTRVTLLVAAVF